MQFLRSAEIRFFQAFTIVIMGVVGMAPVVIILAPEEANAGPFQFAIVGIWFVVAVVAGLTAITAMFEGAYHDDQPYGVAVASMLSRPPRWVAFLLTVWWILHFAVSAVGWMMFDAIGPDSRVHSASTMWELCAIWLMRTSLAYAGSLFIVLAVAVWSPPTEVIGRIWRFRVPISMVLTLLFMLSKAFIRR